VSITAPAGFRAAGVTAGLKPSGRPDLAVVVNDGPDHCAAAVFTSNRVEAAPVTWSRQVLADGRVDAVVLNSGGANACTGAAGFADTHRTAEHLAAALNVSPPEVSPGDVVVASTGLIGELLPMDKITAGIDAAANALSGTGGQDAATAIMTTDTVDKQALATGAGWSVGGMAKGAAMLAPSLATMLVVITTDAVADAGALEVALRLKALADLTGTITGNADAVRLLTIHAAKGLEFKVVVVADAGRDRLPTRGEEILCLPDGRFGFKVVDPSSGKRKGAFDYEAVKAAEEEAGDARPDEDGAGNDAPDAEDKERRRRDGDDRDEIDDALDDDRSEGRRPADPLPIAEVVAPDQLAQPGRQDIVGEIADQEVAEHPRVADRGDRTEEPLPPQRPEGQGGRKEHRRQPDPAQVGMGQHVAGPSEVDATQDEPQGRDRDRCADEGAEKRSRTHLDWRRRAGGAQTAEGGGGVGVRAVSFGERRRPMRWRTYRATTRSVDAP